MTTDLPVRMTSAKCARSDTHIVRDLLEGAIAGAAATWAMGQVTTWLYAREGELVRQRETDVRGGHSAYENAAQTIAKRMGHALSDEQQSRTGLAIHWSTGVMAGALYALTRERWSAPGTATELGLQALDRVA